MWNPAAVDQAGSRPGGRLAVPILWRLSCRFHVSLPHRLLSPAVRSSDRVIKYLSQGSVDNGSVRGTMVIRPYGHSVCECMQAEMDPRITACAAQNAYFPLTHPAVLPSREAEQVEGLSPELAVVTHAGGKQLEDLRAAAQPEPLCHIPRAIKDGAANGPCLTLERLA